LIFLAFRPLIALLHSTGLRRSEVLELDLEDYIAQTREIIIRSDKEKKVRQLFLSNDAAEALSQWLAVRGQAPGSLFTPLSKSGRPQPRPLTDRAIAWILQERAHRAKVAPFSPHDLRRGYISALFNSDLALSTVATLAGHAHTTTTTTYITTEKPRPKTV
jgi:integrase